MWTQLRCASISFSLDCFHLREPHSWTIRPLFGVNHPILNYQTCFVFFSQADITMGNCPKYDKYVMYSMFTLLKPSVWISLFRRFSRWCSMPPFQLRRRALWRDPLSVHLKQKNRWRWKWITSSCQSSIESASVSRSLKVVSTWYCHVYLHHHLSKTFFHRSDCDFGGRECLCWSLSIGFILGLWG